jgi:hypothetical protein
LLQGIDLIPLEHDVADSFFIAFEILFQLLQGSQAGMLERRLVLELDLPLFGGFQLFALRGDGLNDGVGLADQIQFKLLHVAQYALKLIPLRLQLAELAVDLVDLALILPDSPGQVHFAAAEGFLAALPLAQLLEDG